MPENDLVEVFPCLFLPASQAAWLEDMCFGVEEYKAEGPDGESCVVFSNGMDDKVRVTKLGDLYTFKVTKGGEQDIAHFMDCLRALPETHDVYAVLETSGDLDDTYMWSAKLKGRKSLDRGFKPGEADG